MCQNREKMAKNDVFAGESNKKIILISFYGVPKDIEMDKVSKMFWNFML